MHRTDRTPPSDHDDDPDTADGSSAPSEPGNDDLAFLEVLLGGAADREDEGEDDRPSRMLTRITERWRESLERLRQLPQLRERSRARTIGGAALLLLAVACGIAVTAVVVKTHHETAPAGGVVAQIDSRAAAERSDGFVVVLGDETVMRVTSAVASEDRWTALLADGLDSRVVASTSGPGTGYVTGGASGRTFVRQASSIPSDSRVVVFFGGSADADRPSLAIEKAATSAVAAAAARSPGAKIVIVGPVIADGLDAVQLSRLRRLLKVAANVTDATWIDPVDERWLSASAQRTAVAAGFDAADERAIARHLQQVVQGVSG